jgi:phospholipase/carboxylesterase
LSSEDSGTDLIAGFRTIHSPGSHARPLVFLHGSASDETSLLAFSAQVAADHPCYFPRGKEPSEGRLTFFRRKSDKTIDFANLAARSAEVADFVSAISSRHRVRPILIGYSSGAITAAAVLSRDRSLIEGAVLLRPQSPNGNGSFPPLDNVPILLVSGRQDPRRAVTDAKDLCEQLRLAGASAEWHDLACGHELDPQGLDMELTRAWISRRG